MIEITTYITDEDILSVDFDDESTNPVTSWSLFSKTLYPNAKRVTICGLLFEHKSNLLEVSKKRARLIWKECMEAGFILETKDCIMEDYHKELDKFGSRL